VRKQPRCRSPDPSPPLAIAVAIRHQENMQISIASTFVQSVPRRVPTTFDLDIQDVGTVDIPNLYLIFDRRSDFSWTSTRSSQPAMPGRCGHRWRTGLWPARKGRAPRVHITGTPKNMGSFVFKFHVNQYKTHLYEADGTQYVYSWTQTVPPDRVRH